MFPPLYHSIIRDQYLFSVDRIAISGLAISAVGALAGGFGFFAGRFCTIPPTNVWKRVMCLLLAGLAVTGDILLVLGIIGAIFDIINGAIQREKLRDAINQVRPLEMVSRQSKIVLTCASKAFHRSPEMQAITRSH